MKIFSIVIDCKNSEELSDFYSNMLGWKKINKDPEYIAVISPNNYPILLFQENENYIAPIYPASKYGQQQMIHLDFSVEDIDKGVAHAISCGAILSEYQFSDSWKVLIDPAGHPFCICCKGI